MLVLLLLEATPPKLPIRLIENGDGNNNGAKDLAENKQQEEEEIKPVLLLLKNRATVRLIT